MKHTALISNEHDIEIYIKRLKNYPESHTGEKKAKITLVFPSDGLRSLFQRELYRELVYTGTSLADCVKLRLQLVSEEE